MSSGRRRLNSNGNVAYGVLRGVGDQLVDNKAKWNAQRRRYLESWGLDNDGAMRIIEEQVRKIVAQVVKILSELHSFLTIETMEVAVHASHRTNASRSDTQLRGRFGRCGSTALHCQHAGDQLQTVEEPVLEFQRLRVLASQYFAFFKQQ